MSLGIFCLAFLTNSATLFSQDWHVFAIGAFTFSLPPTLHEYAIEGFDSHVVEFTNENLTVGLNYGLNSGRPLDVELARKAGYDVTEKRFDGRDAQIASLIIDPGSSNCYSCAVLASLRGLNLTMFANCKRIEDFDTAIKIFESVRFTLPSEASPDSSGSQMSAQAALWVHSPFESFLPQSAPAESNRVLSPQGYSIVGPVGWVTRLKTSEYLDKNSIADQFLIEGDGPGEDKIHFGITRMGPGATRDYMEWQNARLAPDHGLLGQWVPKEWTRTEFQHKPALMIFDKGSIPNEIIRDYGQPHLIQELFFERDGQGFILDFSTPNVGDRPYFTEPLPIVEQYFETFRYIRPGK